MAYDQLADKTEWETLAVEEEKRFEREYQELVSGNRKRFESIAKEMITDGSSSVSDPMSPASTSTRTLDTDCSGLTLESVWRRPRPCKSLMEAGNSSNMSDLAPFVAALLRDKVVSDLMEETRQLKKKAKENKYQIRHERIVKKAILMVASGCDCGGDGGTIRQCCSTRPGTIYSWATKYTATSSKQCNERKVAMLQSERRCKYQDLLSCRFYVHGEHVGNFSEATNFTVKVFNSSPGMEQGAVDTVAPEVMFFFAVGHHVFGFSAKCKVSTAELLQSLGRPDFPSSDDELDWERQVDLEFLNHNIKPSSRVRFQWAQQQLPQQCSDAQSDSDQK